MTAFECFSSGIHCGLKRNTVEAIAFTPQSKANASLPTEAIVHESDSHLTA
jgi:hypothetical protein